MLYRYSYITTLMKHIRLKYYLGYLFNWYNKKQNDSFLWQSLFVILCVIYYIGSPGITQRLNSVGNPGLPIMLVNSCWVLGVALICKYSSLNLYLTQQEGVKRKWMACTFPLVGHPGNEHVAYINIPLTKI